MAVTDDTESEDRRGTDPHLTALAQELGRLQGTTAQILEQLKDQRAHREREEADAKVTQEALRDLKTAMADIPQETHHAQHDFLAGLIASHRARADLCRRAQDVLIDRALPIGLIALLAVALYAIGAEKWGLALLAKIKP